MTRNVVCEYLNIQGLKLPIEEVQMAVLAVQSVLQVAQAEIDLNILWYQENHISLAQMLGVDCSKAHQLKPVDIFSINDNSVYTLRQLYLAIDSCCTRYHNQSVAVYLCQSDNTPNQLVRLVSLGNTYPASICCDLQQMQQYLFVRTAVTGWLNQIDDVEEWLKDGNLCGKQTATSQLAIPITNEQEQVLGVIFVTHTRSHAFTQSEVIDWVALAIAIVPLMMNLHSALVVTQQKVNNNDKDNIL